MEMGKFAGYNAGRDLLGLPLRPYRQPVYLTCLDLGRARGIYLGLGPPDPNVG
jgi:NADH dehydrogenase